ncbi:MAG: hypothetical protein RIE16_10285, partial [Rhodospirillales bacterium]
DDTGTDMGFLLPWAWALLPPSLHYGWMKPAPARGACLSDPRRLQIPVDAMRTKVRKADASRIGCWGTERKAGQAAVPPGPEATASTSGPPWVTVLPALHDVFAFDPVRHI